MNKRKFLKVSSIVGAGVVLSPLMSCSNPEGASKQDGDKKSPKADSKLITEFSQAELGFKYSALEPKIDAQTMEIHYSKHHAGYVRKLNNALKEAPDFSTTGITDLLAKVTEDQTNLRNNGGGHYNHTMFWECMKPGGSSAPSGKLAEEINGVFGSQKEFQEQFFKAAKTRFGSGWAWLSVDDKGKLFISSTPNQDNPLMANIVEKNGTPILGIDVWEHAYYLKYQNLRGDYINSFMELINWDTVAANLAKV